MKFFRMLLTFVIAGSTHQSLAQTVRFLLPETGSEVAVTFRPSGGANGDLRSFVMVSSGKRTRFMPRNPILRVPENGEAKLQRGIWTDIAGLKLHSSRFFLVGGYTVDSHPHTLLFLLSEGGIGAAPVFVVGFSDDGQPFKVLERNEFDVAALESLDDGALIVGKNSLSEVLGGDGGNGSKKPYATTYDPFSVYKLYPGSPATYSLEATRSYNKKHYVWAGPKVRDDYAVFYNLPGHTKPMGVPASEVDDLLARVGAK